MKAHSVETGEDPVAFMDGKLKLFVHFSVVNTADGWQNNTEQGNHWI